MVTTITLTMEITMAMEILIKFTMGMAFPREVLNGIVNMKMAKPSATPREMAMEMTKTMSMSLEFAIEMERQKVISLQLIATRNSSRGSGKVPE